MKGVFGSGVSQIISQHKYYSRIEAEEAIALWEPMLPPGQTISIEEEPLEKTPKAFKDYWVVVRG